MSKGINLAAKDLEIDLITIINKSGLPPVVVKAVLKELIEQIIRLESMAINKEKSDFEKVQKGDEII